MSNCDSCASKGSCNGSCSTIEKEKLNEMASVKKVIGVMSGKGGVGKSSVTSMLAVEMSRAGYKVGILDADILGPSIPKMFGLTPGVKGNDTSIFPKETHNGIQVMSVNLLLENPEDPVVWRGSIVSGTVKQFWTDVVWNELDVLFIDMPPGTGDVPLTVFQSLPIDGVVIVTSPQELVKDIVGKSYNMTKMMQVPVIGLAENYSFVKCPDCDKEIYIFGQGKTEEAAKEYGVPLLAKIPMDEKIARLADSGEMDKVDTTYVQPLARQIEGILK